MQPEEQRLLLEEMGYTLTPHDPLRTLCQLCLEPIGNTEFTYRFGLLTRLHERCWLKRLHPSRPR